MSVPSDARNGKKRFKAPIACERDLLQELAGVLPPKTNYERLAIVYTQMLLALDAQDAFEICMTYAEWKRRWLPWLSESQIERAFSELAGTGFVDKRVAQTGCFYSIQTFTYPKVKAFPVSANLPLAECEAGARSVRTTPSIRDKKKDKDTPALKPEIEQTAITLVGLLSDFCKEAGIPKPKNCTAEATMTALDELDRLDQFAIVKVESAVRFGLRDSFWQKLILSPAAWRNPGKNGSQKIVNCYLASLDPSRNVTNGNGYHPEPAPQYPTAEAAIERNRRKLDLTGIDIEGGGI